MKRPRANGGFTLVELMIALGILAFALPMIGTAFLAGMVETKESNDNTMLTMVAENAIAIATANPNFRESSLPGGVGPSGFTVVTVDNSSIVRPVELEWRPYYPNDVVANANPAVFGCVLLMQRATGYNWGNGGNAVSGDDYKLVALVFRKSGTVDWTQAGTQVDTAATAIGFLGNGAVNLDPKITKLGIKVGGTSVAQQIIGGYQMRLSLRP